jgi:hypothetical protein
MVIPLLVCVEDGAGSGLLAEPRQRRLALSLHSQDAFTDRAGGIDGCGCPGRSHHIACLGIVRILTHAAVVGDGQRPLVLEVSVKKIRIPAPQVLKKG